jgi:hypothetical protein
VKKLEALALACPDLGPVIAGLIEILPRNPWVQIDSPRQAPPVIERVSANGN